MIFGALHLLAAGCAGIIPMQPSEQRAGDCNRAVQQDGVK